MFALLARAGRINGPLAETLQRMVGFRNIAGRDYRKLPIPIVVAIIGKHLNDFLTFRQRILLQDAGVPAGR